MIIVSPHVYCFCTLGTLQTFLICVSNKMENCIFRDKEDSLKTLMDAIADGNLEGYCIRITECSKVFFCIYFHCTDIVVIHLSCLDFLTIMIYSFGFLLLYRKYVTCLVSGILCNLFMYFNLIKCWENRRSICCKKI